MTNVMTDELWKDIEGYDGRYMVSTHGRIKNCLRGKLLKPFPNQSRGYLEVCLTLNGKTKSIRVHKIVASHFLSGEGEVVNHIDGNKLNNCSDNLEYCSQQYNVEQATGLTCVLVSPEGVTHKLTGLNRFARDNNLNVSALSKVVRGVQTHHKGWTRYV